MSTRLRLEPQTLLDAYAEGVFPMCDEKGEIGWYSADPRGVIPLRKRSPPVTKTLRQVVRQARFEIRFNHDFEAVMRGCMQSTLR